MDRSGAFVIRHTRVRHEGGEVGVSIPDDSAEFSDPEGTASAAVVVHGDDTVTLLPGDETVQREYIGREV